MDLNGVTIILVIVVIIIAAVFVPKLMSRSTRYACEDRHVK